jgi:hypothetical protein
MFKKLFSRSNERGGLVSPQLSRWLSALAHSLAAAGLLMGQVVQAFPPAPPHTIYGVVRDQIGNPLNDGAEVILEASSGTRVRTFVLAHKELPLNYSLEVPMDAGLTADRYSPTALMPAAPFRIRVRIGQSTFLPMEMVGDLSTLGAPGARTRIDLTLGVDEDGNGLPDAWEKAVAAFLGRAWQAGQIRPDDLYPGTGLTYREVYLAGTYAMSPTDGFALQIVNAPGSVRKLAFTVVKGRRYTVQVSDKLADGWKAAPFRLLGADAATQEFYHAAETRRIEIEAPLSGDSPARFYRLIVE